MFFLCRFLLQYFVLGKKKKRKKNALKHFIVVGGLKTTDFFCHFLEFSLFIKIGPNILTLKKV